MTTRFLQNWILKICLIYKIEIYDKLIKKYADYEQDVIKIMMTNYVYLQYGYDREGIRAAINKINIEDNTEFQEIRKRDEAILIVHF